MKKPLVALASVLAIAACSSPPSASDQGLATTICKEQIGCGYQKADQISCESLVLQRLDAARLQTCNDCVLKEGCATEQKACEMQCT
ncbi:MAG: hypothetical protein JST00_36390 [Deltaproteobacteria bacterium]|nr:hypothetical protein [Deltaproteobacteria bacterium]